MTGTVNITAIKGIKKETIDLFATYIPQIKTFLLNNPEIKIVKKSTKTLSHKLDDKNFVISGTLPFSRDQVIKTIEANGGKVSKNNIN